MVFFRIQQLSCYVSALLVPCFDARRLTRRVPLLTLPDHLSSPPVFSVVRVTRSLVLCVCFVDRCLSLCTFSFDHCVVCSSSIYDSDYPFGIFELFSNIYLSCVLCAPCCLCLRIVHSWFPLCFSLTFICSVSCVLNVNSVSGLSIFDFPFVFL